MPQKFTLTIKKTCLDENYRQSDKTRITTNVANVEGVEPSGEIKLHGLKDGYDGDLQLI